MKSETHVYYYIQMLIENIETLLSWVGMSETKNGQKWTDYTMMNDEDDDDDVELSNAA